MKHVFLGLGSNVGDREANIRLALKHLSERNILLDQLSPIYETEPEGVIEQGWFLNAVAEVHTELFPQQLLTCVKEIETVMKRKKTAPNGPRVIDIDILFYQSAVIKAANLEIPHPRLRERRFVLAPMADIAPNWRDPITKRTVAELLAVTHKGRFRRLG